MYHNDIPIIREKPKDSIVKHDEYEKDGKIVRVLYYNNGIVSEATGDSVVKRKINEKEKNDIMERYSRSMELLKIIDEITDENSEISRKTEELITIARGCRY